MCTGDRLLHTPMTLLGIKWERFQDGIATQGTPQHRAGLLELFVQSPPVIRRQAAALADQAKENGYVKCQNSLEEGPSGEDSASLLD